MDTEGMMARARSLLAEHEHFPYYETEWGSAYVGDSMELLAALPDDSIALVITSPPFALWYVSMIMRQLLLEFREENTDLVRLVQRLLHYSQVLVRVKGSLRSPCGRP